MRREAYAGYKVGREVVLMAIEGGGHTWPGDGFVPDGIIEARQETGDRVPAGILKKLLS